MALATGHYTILLPFKNKKQSFSCWSSICEKFDAQLFFYNINLRNISGNLAIQQYICCVFRLVSRFNHASLIIYGWFNCVSKRLQGCFMNVWILFHEYVDGVYFLSYFCLNGDMRLLLCCFIQAFLKYSLLLIGCYIYTPVVLTGRC